MSTSRVVNSLCWITFMLFLNVLEWVESRQIGDSSEALDLASVFSSTQGVVAVCVSSLSFILVVVFALFKCADCYNSEVSTENHPACADSTRKWGGAVGYSSANSGTATASFGETVVPNSSPALPYSLIPTSVPEHAGFQGYHTGDGAGFNSAGMAGYQYQQQASAPSAHYNPAEEQPPPPAYTDALRNSSLRGNR